ncbi:MAG: BamA/TamA family outer membrane protein [candidate division Zixibacteria bacterium]|nr:BamA/TamA family outer membrane protein [candidate division Zixibacteria bacterium]
MLLAFLASLAAAHAGAFGKSVVRNEKFSWRVLPTAHFDIYYYEEEDFLLDWAAEVAEDAYDRVSDNVGFDLSKRVPVVVFMSARHFEQNNISPISGEVVGGFSEPLKGRLVIPYNGSQRQFDVTMTHEMTHIFQFQLLFPTFGALFTVAPPPDWFMEGLAEYVGNDVSPEGEMVLRDAVMSENVPDLKDLRDFRLLPDPYLGYKLGQSVVEYLAETYGDDAPAELLRAFEKTTLRRPDDALEDAFDVKLDDVNEDWKVWLRRRYWPLIGEKNQLKEFATQLTPAEDRRDYVSYFKPNWSPSGDLVACLTVKERFLDIFLVNAKTGEKFENLTKGYSLSKYEYIMYLQNGLSWSPDGNYIAFVGKKDTYDQIYVLNVLGRKIARRYNPKFEDILSPAYSPDGTKIAFAGVKREKRDIYVLDVASGEVKNVTDDFYSDGYPSWSPDGEYIYYASERQTFHNIFRVRPDGTGEEQITFGDFENVSPMVSPDGARLMFVSDRDDSIFNIFVMDLETREAGKYTDVVTGVMDAAWSPDGETIAFTSFENMTYSIWTVPWRDEPVAEVAAERPAPGDYGYETWLASHGSNPANPAPADSGVRGDVEGGEEGESSAGGEEVTAEGEGGEGDTAEEGEAEAPTVRELVVSDVVDESRKYRIKFSPDYLSTTFSYTTGGVLTNYTVFGLSDILGSHRIDVLADLTSVGSFHDVDVALDYYYLTRRTSYIFSAMTWQDYYIARRIAFDQRVSGGSVIASYPLDIRNRVDGGIYGYDRRRRYFYDPEKEPIPLQSDNMLGVVGGFGRDTTQWGYYHPTAGMRMAYTVRQTVPATTSSLYYTEQILDVRRYIRISRRISLAFRAVGGVGLGRDPQNFFLGGGSTLRGYRYSELYGSRFGLGNFELRFPLLDFLVWPIEGFVIGGFRGLFFVDLGSAWGRYDDRSPYPDDWQWSTNDEDLEYDHFTFASKEGGWHLVHGKMSFGTGIRWWFGYFDVKLDWGWRTNLRGVETPPRFHFTLGYDF